MTTKKKKTTKEEKEEVFKDEQGAESALENIKNLFETPASIEKLVHAPVAKRVFAALGQFAELDHSSEQQSAVAGEVFAKILSLPLDAQKQLVWALADQLEVKRPSYESQGAGRKTQGRNELAQVLYGRWPEMLEKRAGSKDTVAGKRITDHVRRYQIRSGQAPTRGKREGGGENPAVPMAAIKKVFVAAWKHIVTDEEQRLLAGVFVRLMGDTEPEIVKENMRLLNKWVDGELLVLAATSLSAVTIKPVEVRAIEPKPAQQAG